MELASLLNLAEALDVREYGSASHCRRVGRFAELIARELGLAAGVGRARAGSPASSTTSAGSALPDDLLAKTGPLTEDEWAWVRAHPAIGARMVETTEYEDIRSWILFHHERPDGRGYPEGRAEADVPLESSIIAVADAYEAMTSERPYRPALRRRGRRRGAPPRGRQAVPLGCRRGAAPGRLTKRGSPFKGQDVRPITDE